MKIMSGGYSLVNNNNNNNKWIK